LGASEALGLERLLSERGFVPKPAGLALLSGPGAKLHVASALPRRETREAPFPTGLATIDALLGGGLARGRLTELVGRRSSGRFSVVLSALASATSCGEAAALVDRGSHLDPQTAREAGVRLERLLWARPRRVKEALAAAEMLLAAGFPMVAVELGLPPLTGSAPEAAWVRLARAAEGERAVLVLSTPYRLSGFAAGAVVQLAEPRFAWEGEGRSPILLTGSSSRLFLERDLGGTSRGSGTLALGVYPAPRSEPDAQPRPLLLRARA
jgi:hypothetical protein